LTACVLGAVHPIDSVWLLAEGDLALKETRHMVLSSAWVTSTYSDTDGGNCVQVRHIPHAVQVRDSKDPSGPVITFTTTGWRAFISAFKSGADHT
jgi:hypothetical protein